MSEAIELGAMLSAIVGRIHLGIFCVDTGFAVLQWNQFMELHTGLPAAEVVGRSLFECVPELPRRWLEQKIRGVFVLKNFAFTSWRQRPFLLRFPHNRPVTGGIDHMQQDVTFMPIKDAAGEVVAVCVMLFDATDACLAQRQEEEAKRRLEEASSALRRLSVEDGLTGIFNRRHLETRLAAEFEHFQHGQDPLSFLIFDLDHFKRVNDGFGHPAGDEVLRTVARRVARVHRDHDVFGRYGGEEFGLVLPRCDGAAAMAVAERVRSSVAAAPVPFGDASIPVTLSVGVAEANHAMSSHGALVREADAALYRSKASGRNCVVRFVPGMAP